MPVYINTYMCIYMHAYIHICTKAHTCMYICKYTHAYKHMCIHAHMYSHLHVWITASTSGASSTRKTIGDSPEEGHNYDQKAGTEAEGTGLILVGEG